VGSSATLGESTSFQGNILASASITMNSGVTIGCGRALANTGAITMIGDTVNAGGCTSTAAPGSTGLSGGLRIDVITGMPQALAFSPVSTVPEPESYAMLLAGLGLIGAVVKRRNAKQEQTFDSICDVAAAQT
jgi:type VI secretion system secreted protein VgrG